MSGSHKISNDSLLLFLIFLTFDENIHHVLQAVTTSRLLNKADKPKQKVRQKIHRNGSGYNLSKN